MEVREEADVALRGSCFRFMDYIFSDSEPYQPIIADVEKRLNISMEHANAPLDQSGPSKEAEVIATFVENRVDLGRI